MTSLSQEKSVEPRDPVIRGLLDQMEALLLDARSLAAELTAEQFNWRPDGRRWSVGQCLEHLTLTIRLYPAKVEQMLGEARARSDRGDGPYREGWFTRWFVRSMEPPPGLRVRTFGKVDPASSLDRDTVLREFEAAHRRFAELMRAADGVSLTHARTSSPFVSWMKFTLGQTFALNLAHGRRHLWQARQVAAHPSFPSGA